MLVPLLLAGVALADPLTLDEALELAHANQPSLAAADARVVSADARADLSRSSLLPHATGSLGWSADADGSGLTYGARAEQTVWDYGAWTSWQSSRWTAGAAGSDAKATSLSVDLDVRTGYYTVLATHQLVAVADEAVENAQLHLDQVAAFIEVEARPEIERAQAKTDLANARVERIRADTDYQIARATLARSIGVDLTNYEPADDIPGPVPGEDGPLDALVTEAMANRPDLDAAQARIEAARSAWTSDRVGATPTISAGVSAGGSSPASQAPPVGVSVGATWPLLQGGATIARARDGSAAIDAAEADLASKKLAVRLDVEQAWRSVTADLAALEAADDAVEAATARLTLASGRYVEGAGNAIEESDARLALTRAKAQRVRTAYDLATARARLLYALGRETP